MDSVIDKELRLSEGHSEEWDTPGEEIRNLPGTTALGVPVTQQ